VLAMLSARGKAIYFPSKGILGQSAEAKTAAINATIGTAFEEDGSPLTLECMEEVVALPSESFLYAPSFGLPALRKQWQSLLRAKNPGLAEKSFSQPVVTAALTHALSVSGYLFVDPGDSVILPDLYWDNYELVFAEAFGARLATYNTFVDGGYDVAALRKAIQTGGVGKKIVLLNFPNNPTGYTATEVEAVAIRDALLEAAQAGNRVVVILDDAYFGLVYEQGVARESLFGQLVDLHENLLAVKLDGPTKEDYVWGLRVGFITFGFKGSSAAHLSALENKAAGAVRGSISNAPSISQAILLKGYAHADYPAQKQRKYELLQARVKRIREILAGHPEYKGSFEVLPFNSGYFMCVKPLGVEAEALRKELLERYRTGVIVLSGLVRLAFSSVPLAQLETLFANLHSAIGSLRRT
jgi:aspartate/methionine/tyrosine aminotransferase